jgi:hypothetical protein
MDRRLAPYLIVTVIIAIASTIFSPWFAWTWPREGAFWFGVPLNTWIATLAPAAAWIATFLHARRKVRRSSRWLLLSAPFALRSKGWATWPIISC